MEFTREELESLRIHELRDLARSVGVKSPTSQKKESIIEQMLQIVSGQSAPYVNSNKQGRPAKQSNYTENLVDVFYLKNFNIEHGGSIQEYNVNYDNRFEFVANAPSVIYNNNQKEQTEIVRGYLDINKNGYGIIRVNGFVPSAADVFLHNNLISKHSLKSGHYIKGDVKTLDGGKIKVMVNVLCVNNVSVQDYKNGVNFEDMEYKTITNKVSFSNVANKFAQHIDQNALLHEGARMLVLNEINVNYTNLIDLVKGISNDYVIYVINLNAKPEEKSFTENNVIVTSVTFNLPEAVQLSTCNLVVEKAKRDVENGKKVIVVINKINVLIKAVNNEDKQVFTTELSINTMHKIKNFIMCAKQTESGSLSLMVLDSMLEETNIKNFILYDLSKVFNSVISISKDCNNVENYKNG